MDKRRLFEELKKNPKNVRFERLCKIAEVLALDLEAEREAIGFLFGRG